MFNDSALKSLENLSIAESDPDLPVENPISTPSSSSTPPMAEDDVNEADLQVEQVPEANRPLRELLAPDRTDTPSCIVIPPHRGTFHFRSGILSMLPIFNGAEEERAYLHLHEFDQVCSTLSDQTCPKDIIRLKLFPITLKNKAKAWLMTLRPSSIRTWSDMHEAFLKKFYPTRLATDLMRQIKTFSQRENEHFV